MSPTRVLLGAIGMVSLVFVGAAVSPSADEAALQPAVRIDNFSYGPSTLVVAPGTTVTWTNRDDIVHGIASSNNAFKKSPAIDTDDTYSFTFTTPGTYQYFCYLHPQMVGSIVVEATTGSNATQ